jgi:iron complex transport system substrate-binding protein
MIICLDKLKESGFRMLKIFFLLMLLACSCTGNKEKKKDCSPDGDREITVSKRFYLEKNDSCTIVTVINPWQGVNSMNLTYYLVKKGSKLPASLDSSSVIFVPLEKIICMSTTHVAMIKALGEENSIAGISGKDYVFSDSLNKDINKEEVVDVGYEGNLNKELILKIAPDLIMMYGIGNESAVYVSKIEELGIKVMYNADYLENDPLGRSEWIKLFGALYCKEKLADSIYRSEVNEYERIKSLIYNKTEKRPYVLLGLPFKDTWYISPGNSYISKLIKDAGGNYLWQDKESLVSMPMGIENVYLRALEADFWLNIGSVCSKDEISLIDSRLENIPCFINGNLYNNNKRVTANGGNDYWQSGSVFPHLILKDMASILHPDLFIDNDLFYYRKIY